MDKLGAVLPICVRGSYDIDDLGRTEILFHSLSTFSDPDLFGLFLIVTPPDEVAIVRDKCKKWSNFNIQVISEEDLVPELKDHRSLRGWRKQQIVKIAAAQSMLHKIFITFDADVICLKPIKYEALIIEGRALLQYEQRAQHPKWWKSSARILNMSRNIGNTDIGMTITPAILSTDLCKLLIKKLTAKKGRSWVDTLAYLHKPAHPSNWTISRYLKSKWTEYSLYYLCAMKHGVLEQYHLDAGTRQTPALMIIHDSHPFETWDTASSFDVNKPGYFCVVGSKSLLEPDVVWEKIRPYIPYRGPGAQKQLD